MVGIIGAVIGFLIFRSFIGAFVGYIIASFIFKVRGRVNFSNGFGEGFSSRISQEDFELNILTLSAFVIKADGIVKKEELNYVRNYFVKIYGETKASYIFSKFKDISNDPSISLEKVCLDLRDIVSYPTKLQLLHYLFGIAKIDGSITQDEIKILNNISHYLHIKKSDFNSIMSMFFYSRENYSTNNGYVNTDNYYKILGVEKSASDTEIKNAYRRLAKLNHPDKVQHLGEEYAEQAKEKFTKIQEAYEKIKSERGF